MERSGKLGRFFLCDVYNLIQGYCSWDYSIRFRQPILLSSTHIYIYFFYCLAVKMFVLN